LKKYSIIVPAYNEESSIGQLLAILNTPAISSLCHVIVVCNGCSDSTFEISNSFTGISTTESAPGKTHALNKGDQMAGELFPRLYLDADVKISAESILDLLQALDTDAVRVGGPRVEYDLRDRPFVVRKFYRATETVPRILRWRLQHLAGRGMYGLSRAARKRFNEFPKLRADDAFIDRRFSRSEKLTVESSLAVISTPMTVRKLIRNEVRTIIGNRELLSASRDADDDDIPLTSGWFTSWRDPQNVNLVIWLSIGILVRILVLMRFVSGRREPWR
jgi:glycosyltransferase involved in cell wall biosynthesis